MSWRIEPIFAVVHVAVSSNRRPATLEYRQGWGGVDREAGDRLRLFVSIDVLLVEDDVTRESLEHLDRDAGIVRMVDTAAEVAPAHDCGGGTWLT